MRSKYIEKIIKDVDRESAILQGERHSFLLSLMVLSSYVIKADGRIMHSEMEFIRNFLQEHYGKEKKEKYEKLLLALFEESKKFSPDGWKEKIAECAKDIANHTTEEQRLLLISFLANIARADSTVDASEISTIEDVASWMGISMEAMATVDLLKLEEALKWNF